jgi:hypothetical protein
MVMAGYLHLYHQFISIVAVRSATSTNQLPVFLRDNIFVSRPFNYTFTTMYNVSTQIHGTVSSLEAF